MNKKYIQALSIIVILTVGMIGIVSGSNQDVDKKTTVESEKICDHKDGAKCENHADGKHDEACKAEHKSGECCKGKMAEGKSCGMKSDKKCTRTDKDAKASEDGESSKDKK